MKSWNAFRSLFAVTTMRFSEQRACHIYRGSGINKASIALEKTTCHHSEAWENNGDREKPPQRDYESN